MLEWELDAWLDELLHVLVADLVVADALGVDDADVEELAAVAGGAVDVGVRDGGGAGGVAELLADIDEPDAAVVHLEGDLVVLDLARGLRWDLLHAEELALRGLEALERAHVVPEAGLGDDVVRGEDAHLVDLWVFLSWAGNATAGDFEFSKVWCHCRGISKNKSKIHKMFNKRLKTAEIQFTRGMHGFSGTHTHHRSGTPP